MSDRMNATLDWGLFFLFSFMIPRPLRFDLGDGEAFGRIVSSAFLLFCCIGCRCGKWRPLFEIFHFMFEGTWVFDRWNQARYSYAVSFPVIVYSFCYGSRFTIMHEM